jgi:hypothetical protein
LSSPVDAKEEDRPIFAWANNSVQDDSEPEQSSGLLKLVLIGGALVLAIASVWGFSRYQREYAVAHFNRGEALKSNNDLIGARRELEACVSECPDGWEKEAAKRELEWIVPAIAAQGKPQPSAEGTERQEAVTGVPIDYPTFYAKSHTGLPVGKRYNFHAILTHDLCIQSDPHVTYDLLCSTRADFDKQEEYESLLRETGYGEGTIVASMGADGTINIHSFH